MKQTDRCEQEVLAAKWGERFRRRGGSWAGMVPLFGVGSVLAYLTVIGAYFLATGHDFDAATPVAVDALAWVTAVVCYLVPVVAALRFARLASHLGVEVGLLVVATWVLAVLSLLLIPVAAFVFGVLFTSGTSSFEEAPLLLGSGIAGPS